jgi:hypothetical protein
MHGDIRILPNLSVNSTTTAYHSQLALELHSIRKPEILLTRQRTMILSNVPSIPTRPAPLEEVVECGKDMGMGFPSMCACSGLSSYASMPLQPLLGPCTVILRVQPRVTLTWMVRFSISETAIGYSQGLFLFFGAVLWRLNSGR